MKKASTVLNLSRIEFKKGSFTNAIKILEKFIGQKEIGLCERQILKELGYYYYLRGNGNKAESYLLQALKQYKQKKPILNILSELYQKELRHKQLNELNIKHDNPFSHYLVKSDVYKTSQGVKTQIKFRNVKNWHLINVKIQNNRINCMFDTGSTNLTCISPDLFNKLVGKKIAKKLKSFKINVDAPLANFDAEFGLINYIEIGEIKISKLPCIIMPFNSINDFSGEKIDMIISPIWIKKGKLSFDFENSTVNINLTNDLENNNIINVSNKKEIEFISNYGQRIITQIIINNKIGLALWDSGTPLDFMISPKFLKENFSDNKIITEKIQLGNNIIKYSAGKMNIELGGYKFNLAKSIGTNVVDNLSKLENYNYLSLIGSGLEKHLNKIVYNFKNQVIKLILKN